MTCKNPFTETPCLLKCLFPLWGWCQSAKLTRNEKEEE